MEIFENSKESSEGLKGKVKAVGEIAIDSAIKQIGDAGTMSTSLSIGLVHGLISGSVKRGVKTSLVILGVVASANVVKNIASNWDAIKNQ